MSQSPDGRQSPRHPHVRRAIKRAQRGLTLDEAEVTALLASRGTELDELCAVASQIRDRGFADRGSRAITYSPKVFIPLTRLCRDNCHYCTFAASPAQLRSQGQKAFLEPDEVVAIARAGSQAGALEALFTLGDRPEDRWPSARDWLDQRGYDTTLAYVRAMAIKVLEETGLLPHLNPGVMSWQEMARLRPVAPSMGMMLETTSHRLWSTPGLAHYRSPDKEPAVRLRVLEDAGRLAVPFTTGLLVGIGETTTELADSLLAIRRIAREHGHIQEVIIQNFRAKPATAMAGAPDLDFPSYRAAIATARVVFGPRMRIQAPPNLTDIDELGQLLATGIDDWGGVSPVTVDHVNPERPWPELGLLREATQRAGFELRARLTVHPQYVLDPQRWLDPHVRSPVAAIAAPDGFAAPAATPVGRIWQQADETYDAFADSAAGGRIDLDQTIDITGRTADRRSDFADVYGDWREVADRSMRIHRAPERLAPDLRAALSIAATQPSALATEQHRDAAIALMSCDGAALRELTRLADAVRREVVGDDVTYVVNRNINFTNVCYTGCRFCAFAQRRTDADAFTLSLAEVGDRVDQAWSAGATEICMQGGIHPDLPGTAYFDLVREVKRRAPGIHLHAFSPMEIVNGAARSNMTVREWLEAAREAGLDSIPGTAAEILDDDVRWVLTKGKLPASTWIEVVSTAHEIGLPSSSTMMYGHVDSPQHWVGHLATLRQIQERTGGFTEFVGLPFVHHNAPLYLAGIARAGSTLRDDLAVTALARLMLHGAIDHIQVSWVKLGPQGCARLLAAGADDLGGTLMEETISRMAGSEHGSAMTVEALRAIAESVQRPARQRTTTYANVPVVGRLAHT